MITLREVALKTCFSAAVLVIVTSGVSYRGLARHARDLDGLAVRLGRVSVRVLDHALAYREERAMKFRDVAPDRENMMINERRADRIAIVTMAYMFGQHRIAVVEYLRPDYWEGIGPYQF